MQSLLRTAIIFNSSTIDMLLISSQGPGSDQMQNSSFLQAPQAAGVGQKIILLYRSTVILRYIYVQDNCRPHVLGLYKNQESLHVITANIVSKAVNWHLASVENGRKVIIDMNEFRLP